MSTSGPIFLGHESFQIRNIWEPNIFSFTFYSIFGTTWLCTEAALIIFSFLTTDIESLNHLLWDYVFSGKWFEFKFHLAYSPLVMQDWIHFPGEPWKGVLVDILHGISCNKFGVCLLYVLVCLLDASLGQNAQRNTDLLLAPPDLHFSMVF